ncbi:MAG: hypothetical protein RLZ71_201 [Actinomycetota bacterium]|jgi:exodeoxyribonuclease VII large subunit
MTETGLSSEDRPYSVKEFSERVSGAIKRWPSAYVEGELVKFKTNFSGHAYPALKDLDGAASIELVIFAGVLAATTEVFQDGDRVVVNGTMDYYVPSGKLSLKVSSIRKVGLGDLLAKLEELRQRLIAEGVINPANRKPLPFLPRKVGLITGKDSDAEKDVLENARLRWPSVQFEIVNTPVQGDGAAPAVIKAIEKLDNDPEVDVIIIARGGGAFLDLICFSDEALVRAAAACKTAIVSAIGHENDRPILDDVADLRASTPTDAAKRVVPDAADERARIEDALARMVNRISGYVDNQLGFIAQLRSRPILTNPYAFIDDKTADLSRAVGDLRSEIDRTIERAVALLEADRGVLRSLSPQGILDRGYSVLRDENGHVITDASKVKKDQKLRVRLAKGELGVTAND